MTYTDADYLNFAEMSYLNLQNIENGKTMLGEIFNSIAEVNYWKDNKNFEYYSETFGFIDDKENEIDSPYKDYVILDYVHNDKGSGFGAIALQAPDGEIIISFRGSDYFFSSAFFNDWSGHNFKQVIFNEYYSNQDQEAIEFAKNIISKYPNSKTHLAGHSLGGHLTQVVGCEFIENDNVETIFAWDTMGVQNSLLVEKKDGIEGFIARGGKYIIYELTCVSQTLNQPDIEGIIYKYLKQDPNLVYNDRGEPSVYFEYSDIYLHGIKNLRDIGLKYENGRFILPNDRLSFKDGRISFKNFKFEQILVPLIIAFTGYDNYTYKDINTGMMMQVTQERDNLTIDEFLKKYNANYKWEKGEIVEKIKTRKLKENPQYLVRGAIIKCSRGTNVRRVDLSNCHGVYFKKGPALHLEDCAVGEYENIKSFGFCECGKDRPMTSVLSPKRDRMIKSSNHKCELDILEKWFYAHDNTYIVRDYAKSFKGKYNVFDLLNALTENSFLVCAKGGLIEVVTSGQEYYRSIPDEILEEELSTLDSEGETSVGSNIENEKVYVSAMSEVINDKISKTIDKIKPIINEKLDNNTKE